MSAVWASRQFWLGVALGAVLPAVLLVARPHGRRAAGLGVNIALDHRDTNTCLLTVTVANRGGSPFTFDLTRAPWDFKAPNVYSALLAEDAEGRTRRPIRRWTPAVIDDPFGWVTVRPGETITNYVELDLYYWDVMDALRQGDVLLLWLYEPMSTTGLPQYPPITGHLRIPRLR